MSRRPERLTREAIAAAAMAPVLLVACDYDGTLAPIVSNPEVAYPDEGAVALRQLAALPNTSVAVISGRARADLAGLIGDIPGAVLVGCHGAEWEEDEPPPLAAELTTRLRTTAVHFPGARVEAKPTGAAFHWRQVDPLLAESASEAAVAAAGDLPARIMHGKRVVEMSISDADKGTAIDRLRREIRPDLTVFIGDDVTDEDGFAALGPADISIKVGDGQTTARFRIAGQSEVAPLLEQLISRRLKAS